MAPTLGIVARADLSRGLGTQTFAWWQHLGPDRVLVVDMGDLTPYDQQFDAFQGGPDRVRVARLHAPAGVEGTLPVEAMEWLCSGVDVVATAETPYDYRLFDIAREHDCRTVVHINPEFHRWTIHEGLPRPDCMVAPTRWRMKEMARDGSQVGWLPQPCDPVPGVSPADPDADGPLRVTHVAGHPAIHDRAGTSEVLAAARLLSQSAHLTVWSQSERPPPNGWARTGHDWVQGDQPDRAVLYDGFHMMLTPRRYGGQHLPAIEAVASGLVVLASNCPPLSGILPGGMLIPARRSGQFRAQGGQVDMFRASDRHISKVVTNLHRNRGRLKELAARGQELAEAWSWESLGPVWARALEAVAEGCDGPQVQKRALAGWDRPGWVTGG